MVRELYYRSDIRKVENPSLDRGAHDTAVDCGVVLEKRWTSAGCHGDRQER